MAECFQLKTTVRNSRGGVKVPGTVSRQGMSIETLKCNGRQCTNLLTLSKRWTIPIQVELT